MAKQSGLGQRFYAHGYDISGDVGSITKAASPSGVQDVTAINVSGHERRHTLVDGELSWQGFFNDASSQIHDALKATRQTDWILSWLLGTDAGDQVANLVAQQMNYDYTRAADGGITNACQGLSDSGYGLEWALLLTAAGKVTHASADDETGIDHGAQTTDGGVGFLQHFSGGSGTIEYDLEDSSDSTDGDDGTWANLLAFTDVATPYAATAQRVEVTGTVERWVRASTNGTFTNAVFHMSFLRN